MSDSNKENIATISEERKFKPWVGRVVNLNNYSEDQTTARVVSSALVIDETHDSIKVVTTDSIIKAYNKYFIEGDPVETGTLFNEKVIQETIVRLGTILESLLTASPRSKQNKEEFIEIKKLIHDLVLLEEKIRENGTVF